jgi:hypothetical protein
VKTEAHHSLVLVLATRSNVLPAKGLEIDRAVIARKNASRQIGVLQDLTVVKCYVDAGQPYVINLNACCT